MTRCGSPQPGVSPRRAETIEQRLRRVVAIHFDPEVGTPFWLDRAAALKIDPLRDVQQISDLDMLGTTHAEELNTRPLQDYLPRRFHREMHRFRVAQTGGTTGTGTWTAYREDEFEEAFVHPFTAAARPLGFPSGATWLFVGPSGPHIIGKVVRRLAKELASGDPFSVDFDPRWAKKLPEGSFARQRYLQHVLDQAMQVVNAQDVDVLFTTPVVLQHLAAAMSDRQRERIRGVHYGGMTVVREQLLTFQRELFPRAVHLSGYGNTLFGCCLELSTTADRTLDYFPHGERLLFDVVDPQGRLVEAGQEGQVRFTRLDESMLIVRMKERDAGTLLAPPEDGLPGFTLPGIRDPHPLPSFNRPAAIGLY